MMFALELSLKAIDNIMVPLVMAASATFMFYQGVYVGTFDPLSRPNIKSVLLAEKFHNCLHNEH